MPAERMLVRRRARPVRDRIIDVLLPDKVTFPLAEWNRDRMGLQKTFEGRNVTLKTIKEDLVGRFVRSNSEGIYLSVDGKATYVPKTSLVMLEATD